MAKPLYQVLQIDVATPRDSNPIVEVGIKYDAVTIHQLPAGGGMSLKLGPNQAIPLIRTETFRFLDKCEHPFFCDEGLFLTNVAGAGILILIVSLGTNPEIQP
jgi:hypothetical protein